MSQKDVEKFLMNRGGNRGLTFDAWEGFGNTTPVSKDYLDNFAYLNNNSSNNVITDLPDINARPQATPTITPTSLSTSSQTPSATPVQTFEPKYTFEEKFYKDDKILTGDYFKGWNDSYFFQSSVFRNNADFWVNPFKNN